MTTNSANWETQARGILGKEKHGIPNKLNKDLSVSGVVAALFENNYLCSNLCLRCQAGDEWCLRLSWCQFPSSFSRRWGKQAELLPPWKNELLRMRYVFPQSSISLWGILEEDRWLLRWYNEVIVGCMLRYTCKQLCLVRALFSLWIILITIIHQSLC